MKQVYKTLLLIVSLLIADRLSAAFLTKLPVSLSQPDGSILECMVSGDEFYNRFHDAQNYTIVRSQDTGYLVYAEKRNGELHPGKLIPGRDDPTAKGQMPALMISETAYRARRESYQQVRQSRTTPTTGTINNVVVYIRFADQTEFSILNSAQTSLFNSAAPDTPSLRSYFLEASYSALTINSYFLPTQSGATVVSYQDINDRSYYLPWDSTNPNGYTSANRSAREQGLLSRATAFVSSMLPTNLNLDVNNDGYVDNIIYFLRGSGTGWGGIIWPHQSVSGTSTLTLGSKIVHNYNINVESMGGLSVLCHEFGHSLGASDYYPYYTFRVPAGTWELMSSNLDPPQHFSAYLKWHYFGWISDIPILSSAGLYSLNPISSPTNQAYRILSPNPDEYFILEYRRKSGLYESSVPGSGLLIWRVNSSIYNGNSLATTPELYVYRPGGTLSEDGNVSQAAFSQESGRFVFNNTTDPACFLSDGSPGNVQLFNIGNAGASISFQVGSYYVDFSVNPHTETFGGSSFPLPWTTSAMSGTEVFQQVESGTAPNCSPFSPGGMLGYASHNVPSGYSALLATPRVEVANSANSRYSVAFRIFRDSASPSLADRIEVYRNSSPNLTGSPLLLGTIHRSMSLAPVTGVFGWNLYTFPISFPGNGNYYIVFKAIGAGGNNLFLDDLKLERHCHAQLTGQTPSDESTMVPIDPVFSWAYNGLSPSGCKFYLGTDNPPSNLVNGEEIGLAYNYAVPANLPSNSLYYWQVVPYDQFGSGLDLPILSFRTIALSPQILPWQEDFESVEPPDLPLGWGIVKSSSSSQFWQTTAAAAAPSGAQTLQSSTEWLLSPGLSFSAGQDYRIMLQCRLNSGVSLSWVDVYLSETGNPADPKTQIIHYSATNSYAEAYANISIGISGTRYLLFTATNTVLIDDVKVFALLSASLVNPSPAEGAAEVGLNPQFSWQLASGTPSGFYLSFGTDNPPSNISNRLDIGYSFSWTPPLQLGFGVTYHWCITPYNAQGEALNNPVWSFSTLGTATLPLNEAFDATTVPQIPQGWTVISVDNDTNLWHTSNQTPYSSPNCIRVERNDDQASNDWLISPPVKLYSGYTYRLQYRYRASSFSPSEKLQIAYGSAPQPSLLTNVISDNTSIGNTGWAQTSQDFTPTADGIWYIGFRSYGSAYSSERYLYLDNISLKCQTLPTPVTSPYPAPEAQNHPINRYLAWEHAGDVSGYKLFLGTDNPPTNLLNNQDIGTSLSYNPGQMWAYDTSYYWQVVPYNSAGNSTGSAIFSFRTMAADNISLLPYYEGLDGVAVPNLPGGYLVEDTNQDGISWLSSGTSNKLLRINSSPTITTGDWIFLPGLEMLENVPYTFNFSYRQGMNGKTIGVRAALFSASDSGAEIASLFENNSITFSSGSWLAEFTYIAQENGLAYLGIQCIAAPNQGYLTIDNIRIRTSLIPATGMNPADGSLGIHYQPVLSWISPPIQPVGYKLFLGTDNPPGNVFSGLYLPNINEYQLPQSLSFGSTYYWQIVPYNYQEELQNCPIFSFTVMPANTIGQLPYLQDFETAEPPYLPQDMVVIDANSDAITWVVSEVDPTGGAKSAFISASPEGQDDWLILPPVYLQAGLQYQLSFKAKKAGTTPYALFKIYRGGIPSPEGLTDLVASVYSNSSTYLDYSYAITPSVSGAVYFGIKAAGWPNQSGLYLDNLSFTQLSAPLSPPRQLIAAATYTTIDLSWQAPLSRNLHKYKVFRDGMLIAELNADQLGYSDSNLIIGTEYSYFVKAAYLDPSGDSESSNVVVASLYVDPPSPYLWQEDFAENPFDQGEYFSWSAESTFWSWQNSAQAGGTSPEMVFQGTAGPIGEFSLHSPFLETMLYSSLALSFRHSMSSTAPGCSLKLELLVGTEFYPIATWQASTFSNREEFFYLNEAEHGIGQQVPVRLRWTVSGEPSAIAAWSLDDIALIRDFSILPLTSPANVNLAASNTELQISWDAVSGAVGYRIYASDQPQGDTWSFIQETQARSLTLSPSGSRRFFRVTAIR